MTEIVVDWDREADCMEFIKFAKKYQMNLRKVTGITENKIPREKLNALVTEVLKITRLQEFQLFFYHDTIHWDTDWSISLNNSNVQTLRILCFDLSFTDTAVISHPRNEKLTTFAIRVKYSLSSNIIPLLEKFPKLRDLSLSHVTNATLESICKNQVRINFVMSKNLNCCE